MTQCKVASGQLFSASENQLQKEKTIALQAKALSHPARLRILNILSALERDGGCLNSDLVSQLGLAQSTVSEHLRILKVAGFISAEPTPPKVCYRIKRQSILTFSALIDSQFK
ncbi:winged helix-turn-helix domain-containing protein [Vibrio sp. ZSDZ34]|jgi:DNA-binding transcriptional ArsR family regulator|uniref:Winged helix-turn-helix domain-containing protein n=1 Tax=Vibrio gelatinilyticus TaxID=2893468 RepID=A0A9X1WCZ2_9VIBR|nr:winged helix-turn-helix domain-containing protein [Vibrio gelatinilyticus]MCJ2378004.1 winged helix-turn-helix domain-containing protein [Vibrio gelatinilyticus]